VALPDERRASTYGDDFPQTDVGSLFGSPRTQTLEEYKKRIEYERKAYGLDRTGIEAKRTSLQAMQQAANERAREINAPLAALKGFLTLAASNNPNFVQSFSSSALGAVTEYMEGDAQIKLADLEIEKDALAYAEGDYTRLEKDYEKYAVYKGKREDQYMELLKNYSTKLASLTGKEREISEKAWEYAFETIKNTLPANPRDNAFQDNPLGMDIYMTELHQYYVKSLSNPGTDYGRPPPPQTATYKKAVSKQAALIEKNGLREGPDGKKYYLDANGKLQPVIKYD
jgi:hypothetical protein